VTNLLYLREPSATIALSYHTSIAPKSVLWQTEQQKVEIPGNDKVTVYKRFLFGSIALPLSTGFINKANHNRNFPGLMAAHSLTALLKGRIAV
jgi:hypothetical protein